MTNRGNGPARPETSAKETFSQLHFEALQVKGLINAADLLLDEMITSSPALDDALLSIIATLGSKHSEVVKHIETLAEQEVAQ